jgi:IS1 family transposase
VPGKRTAQTTEALVAEFRRRTGGRMMRLMTSDDYPAYETAILHAYGETVTPPRTGERGRPRAPYQVPPPGLTYATVTKRREKGRVVEVGTRVVFGTVAAVLLALGMSKVSRAINTSFVERQNGTDRHRNARKARKTYRFSKDWRHHEAVTYLSMYVYNFCWPVRTLRIKDEEGRWRTRSPAMAAGLADHVRSIAEWLSRPAVQHC